MWDTLILPVFQKKIIFNCHELQNFHQIHHLVGVDEGIGVIYEVSKLSKAGRISYLVA